MPILQLELSMFWTRFAARQCGTQSAPQVFKYPPALAAYASAPEVVDISHHHMMEDIERFLLSQLVFIVNSSPYP